MSALEEANVYLYAPAKDRQAFTLASWLRWIGAAAIVLAGARFLVEGWAAAEYLERSAMFVGLTLTLCAAGWSIGRRAGDARGARTLFALAAMTIPGHFAQLGALFFSRASQANPASIGATVGALVAVALVVPLSILGLSALVRTHGKRLGALLSLFSAVLLVPTRNPQTIAALAVGLGLVIALCEALWLGRDPKLRTAEASFARAMLFAPLMILLVRSMFYPTNDVLLSALLGLPGLILLVTASSPRRSRALAAIFQLLGVSMTAAAAMLLLSFSLAAGVLLAAIYLGVSCLGDRNQSALRGLGSIALGMSALTHCVDPAAWSLLTISVVASAYASVAFHRRDRGAFLRTVIGLLAMVIWTVGGWMRLPQLDLWIAPAVAGIVLVLVASKVDRVRLEIRRWLDGHFVL